ncbi:hypothetical protein BDB00DRAFT_807532 [Zychaea mexicana]|uniref:uncharacterized protein n=1 Tax=Zychaea mexicana TaxID=64656 RepID=UPI0022FE0C9C|nr:uncharacterized protein BDB00DRAFT_807532 [Zychaea mexicana]KAI9496855.1 hypothetical protein BDB00DRAFT_807532 [Zychaea mexicana]
MNPAAAAAAAATRCFPLLFLLLLTLAAAFTTTHAYKQLSDDALTHMAGLSASVDEFQPNGERLKPLLVPRVAGTPENARVRQSIVDHFQTLGWHVELDPFNDETPLGTTSFTNVIATFNPDAKRRLVLAAHFDSKYYEEFEFIGATDSAVPCAVLMDIAETLNPIFSAAAAADDNNVTLQMVFFDGEEAFVRWTDTDSIYGARHLAEKWETTYVVDPPMHTIKSENELSRIDVLVLLDLLGTPNPTIPNYYRETNSMYYNLVRLEERLAKQGLLETHSLKDEGQALRSIFNPQSAMTFQGRMMGDDHVPFLRRGVNILHIIPSPFPSVWHNQADNQDCIDPAVVRNLATLFRGFVMEYLELSM